MPAWGLECICQEDDSDSNDSVVVSPPLTVAAILVLLLVVMADLLPRTDAVSDAARDTSAMRASMPLLMVAITAAVPVVKAVVTWHDALSLSDLQGAYATCHCQRSALATTYS